MSSNKNAVNKVALIIGCGPGVGSAVAHKFASQGFKIGLISRQQQTLDNVTKSLTELYGSDNVSATTADAGNEQSLRQGTNHIVSKLGDITVLVYNVPAYIVKCSILDIKPYDLTTAFNIGTVGLLTSLQEVLPYMLQHKHGTILVTGATSSLRGSANYGGLSSVKGATRNLAQSVARELQPQGIHVAHIIIDGLVSNTSYHDPSKPIDNYLNNNEIAQQYYNLHTQHHTTWTFELDSRPYTEKW